MGRTNEPRERKKKEERQEDPDVRQHLSRVAIIFERKKRRTALIADNRRALDTLNALIPVCLQW